MRHTIAFTLLAAAFSLAIPGSGHALIATEPFCSKEKAEAAAKADEKIVAFCTQEINGQRHGCDFRTRPSSPENPDEVDRDDLMWIVKASIIHSYNEEGQPLYMPEGAAFAHISDTCEVIDLVGPWGPAEPME